MQFLELELPDGQTVRVEVETVKLTRTSALVSEDQSHPSQMQDFLVRVKVNPLAWPEMEREIAMRFVAREMASSKT